VSKLVQQKQLVNGELEEVRRKIDMLEGEQQQLDVKLAELREQQNKHQLLDEISERLNQLEEVGAGQLFWADEYREDASKVVIRRIQHTVSIYQANLSLLMEKRRRVLSKLEDCSDEIFELDERAQQLKWEEEDALFEFEVSRAEEPQDYRPVIMPWHTQGEDERRFRRCLFASLLLCLFLGYTVPLWQLPEPDENEVIEVPERLAKLVLEKKKPKPPEPIEKKREDKEKPPEPKQQLAKEDPKPAKPAEQKPAKKVERAGVLAFKDNFQDLIQDDLDNRLGEQTQLSTANKRENRSQRSMITAAASAGSGGINTSALSRNVGGGGGTLEGVSFSRVESAIGTEGTYEGEERPLSDGVGPSRTDEEIQIVFDRYKSALYRIYNRELRENPALQGKMVLRITILPDGAVSLAKVETSDMDSPSLNSKIVARVTNFNFGAKDGVPTITILYPIDFLPAA
jgi:outer membrane biosynthesis protein TonB